jgi:hypothetical protein
MPETHRRGFLRQTTQAGCALCVGALPVAAEKSNPLRILTLEGEPAERGLKHGTALKEPIHALVKVWKADLAERYRMAADAFIKKFLQQTDYLAAMKKWTPQLIDEIRGIARGAELDFDTILVLQLIDEYWARGPQVVGEHCSALGISRHGERPSCIAQNMDLEGFRTGFQTVLHIRHSDAKLESFVLTHAGLIGLNGMNSRAIGICCNTLGQLANCADGLPVACIVRGVLEQQTEEAALNLLSRIKHASGQNYIVGGPTAVHDVECSAGKVSRFSPKMWPDRVWHTNHPLVNDDYSPQHRKALEKEPDKVKAPANSAARLQCLERRLATDADKVGLDLIRATLAAKDSADYPVCRPYRNAKDNCTFASTIMVLSDKPEFHVAPGPPDVHAYQIHAFGR